MKVIYWLWIGTPDWMASKWDGWIDWYQVGIIRFISFQIETSDWMTSK